MSKRFFTVMSAAGGSGVAINTTIKTDFPVLGGRGLLAGDSESAVARELIPSGPLRIEDPAGIQGNPRFSILPSLTEIARQTIDATKAAAQRIEIAPDILECEIVTISFRRFSAAPGAELQAGIYAAPPVLDTGIGFNVNPAGARVLTETTQFNGWPGGLATMRLSADAALRAPVALWWCPRLINGVAQVSASPLSVEISIWAMPIWRET